MAAFVQSEAFSPLMKKVQAADRVLFQEAERWLANPIHDAPIYASPNEIWASLASEFQGSFRQMLYNDDVPDDAEVIGMLEMLHLRLHGNQS